MSLWRHVDPIALDQRATGLIVGRVDQGDGEARFRAVVPNPGRQQARGGARHRGRHAGEADVIFAGDTVVGGKQNRIINVPVWLPAASATAIPVSCLEHGRWVHLELFRIEAQRRGSKATVRRAADPLRLANGDVDAPAFGCRLRVQGSDGSGAITAGEGLPWISRRG